MKATSVSVHLQIFLFVFKIPNTPSPPRSVPQPQVVPSPPQANPTDVFEQTTDPVDLGTSWVVPPEQTIAIPSQGKVPITESLPMIL